MGSSPSREIPRFPSLLPFISLFHGRGFTEDYGGFERSSPKKKEGAGEYQGPFQQGSRAEGVPPLDLRVPARQDAGARGFRALGDTPGRLARLTSEQHLDREKERPFQTNRALSSAPRGLPEGSSRRRRLGAAHGAFKVYRSQLDHVSFILVLGPRRPSRAAPRELARSDRVTTGHRLNAVRGRWIWRLRDGVYVVVTNEGTALTRPRLTPPPVLAASAPPGIFSTVA